MLRFPQVIKGHPGAAEVVFAVLVVALPGCGVAVEPDPRHSNEPQAPWSLGYRDGSGNGYRIWRSSDTDEPRFEYAPVRPESSSSGTYSGGDPVGGRVSGDPVEELWRRTLELEADVGSHVAARTKGSGVFRLATREGEREFMVAGDPRLRALDGLLRSVREGLAASIKDAG